MKKCLAVILSILCVVNLLACSAKSETAEMTGNGKLAGTLELEKAKKTEENGAGTQKKKKSIRLDNGNIQTESDSSANENMPEEYRYLFTDGSFDEKQVWSANNMEYAELIEALQAYCEESAIGSIMLATDEEVIFAGGFNALEVDGETTVNSCTTYEIGSITQEFMAAAILQQVQEGNLKTSDTIERFFPEYSAGSKITIDDLLHMTSGIPDFINESHKFFSGRTAEGYDAFMNGRMPDEEILGYLYKAELNFEPGKKMSYSNTNYFLLALILEQVTGETYEEYLQKNIFEVCGLKNTTCTETGNITSMPQGNGEYLAMGRVCRGMADIHSNVCDILIWNRALMAGVIMNEQQINYMTEPKNGYACGWSDMGNGAIGCYGSTWSYMSVNIVYQDNGENLYFIMMLPDDGKWGVMGKATKIVEKYLAK